MDKEPKKNLTTKLNWTTSFERHNVIPRWQDPLRVYFDSHVAPDDEVLVAALHNDAIDVAVLVTHHTFDDFVNLMEWLTDEAPSTVAWGSPGAFARWVSFADKPETETTDLEPHPPTTKET